MAEISSDTMAGIVVAPTGCWTRPGGDARTVNAINPPAFAEYGNAPTAFDTLVEVTRHRSA